MSTHNGIDQNNKRTHGQFFTTTNPFVNEAFVRWFKSIPGKPTLLEPFAGANNIVWMVQDLGYDNDWNCFDLQPLNDPYLNVVSGITIMKADTINNYPKGYEVAITNPPYLAKNSATRRGLAYAGGDYDDVYKKALDVMLKSTPYVAAIIPESFITQNLFHDRLDAVVSLTCRMFDDTEVPVCLALFSPAKSKLRKNDFMIWSGNRQIGSFATLSKSLLPAPVNFQWKFNDPKGLIGLHGIDDKSKGGSIRFVPGNSIKESEVKCTSRSITRISFKGLKKESSELIIQEANRLLEERRKSTKDVFLTAFKGLRVDGKYRRRLDYSQARDLLDIAYCNMLAMQNEQEAA